jgi:VanZ family protein
MSILRGSMRIQFLVAYTLGAVLFVWSIIVSNNEFLIYAGVTMGLLGFLHWSDRLFHYYSSVLWMFDIWIILHILGGLLTIGDGVLYSLVLIPVTGEPYLILKYDQLVHVYCYFVVALIVCKVVMQSARPEVPFGLLAVIIVLAATGIGALNEIVEFIAVVSVPQTNVGGYENTLIDVVANLLGALLAVPFFRRYA